MASQGGTPSVIRRPRLPVIAGPPQSDPNSPIHSYQEFCNGIEVCASMDSPFDSDDVTMEDCGAVYLSVDEQLNRCVSSDCLDTTSMDIDICTLDNRLDWREEQLYSISDNESNSDTRAQCEEETRDDFSDIESANKLKGKPSHGSSDISEQRRSSELEKCFDEMGLEKTADNVVQAPTVQQLESVSCNENADSTKNASNRDSQKNEPSNLFNDKSFILERNSRIMKWLNSVKKTHSKSNEASPP